MHDHVGGLSDSARTAAEGSIGQANAVAATLPGDAGTALHAAAGSAFTDALGLSLAVAGACAFVGAVAVRRWLPAQQTQELDVPLDDELDLAA
jgi:DHA2 family multidrug resistance protein-like MFS transporter